MSLLDVRQLQKLGRDQAEAGELDAALASWDLVCAREPGDAWSLYQRGCVKARLGRHAEAEADFTRALAPWETYLDALAARAAARRELGNTAGALADLRQALYWHPDDDSIAAPFAELAGAALAELLTSTLQNDLARELHANRDDPALGSSLLALGLFAVVRACADRIHRETTRERVIAEALTRWAGPEWIDDLYVTVLPSIVELGATPTDDLAGGVARIIELRVACASSDRDRIARWFDSAYTSAAAIVGPARPVRTSRSA